jgi:predicted acetyltransferase
MTTLAATRVQLQAAEPADILAVLRSSYALWGGGMSREDYVEWIRSQSQSFYWRKNVRYLAVRSNGSLVCTCKLYTLSMRSRGRFFKVAGIGAVYTMPEHRGRGHASEMIEAIEQLAKQEDYDALLLYSDIDPSFYEQAGYQLLSDCDFYLWLNEPLVQQQIMSDRSFAEDLHRHDTELGQLEPEVACDLLSHYSRYAASLPFALVRDEHYWLYKLNRELFLQSHSRTDRPMLEYLSMEPGSPDGGYAIFEQFDKVIRVLEVVGRAEARDMIWRNLLRAAMLRRVSLIRGWEGISPCGIKGIQYAPRDMARPMLLPLSEEAKRWSEILPCPLLELDHF